jgi:HAMP domain-containing protein
VSDATSVIVLLVCLIVAIGGFFTSIRLIRRVRARAEAENEERDRSR